MCSSAMARRGIKHMKIFDLDTCKTGFSILVLVVWIIFSPLGFQAQVAGASLLVLVVWIIFSPLGFQAQVAGASLSGTVSDASGAALAGAKIRAYRVLCAQSTLRKPQATTRRQPGTRFEPDRWGSAEWLC